MKKTLYKRIYAVLAKFNVLKLNNTSGEVTPVSYKPIVETVNLKTNHMNLAENVPASTPNNFQEKIQDEALYEEIERYQIPKMESLPTQQKANEEENKEALYVSPERIKRDKLSHALEKLGMFQMPRPCLSRRKKHHNEPLEELSFSFFKKYNKEAAIIGIFQLPRVSLK